MNWDLSDVEAYARKHRALFEARGLPVTGKKARKPPAQIPKEKLKPDPYPWLSAAVVAAGFEAPEREFLFAAAERRDFRFDYAWPSRMVAVEVDGIVHRLAKRWKSDIVKQNMANAKGWTLFRFKPKDVKQTDGGPGARVVIEHLRHGGEVSAPTIATLWPPGKE